MADYGLELVRFVPDPGIMRERDPTPLPNTLQPFLVRAVMGEMIRMPLNDQPRLAQNLWERLSKVAVREEYAAHPARSYNTACSISPGSRS